MTCDDNVGVHLDAATVAKNEMEMSDVNARALFIPSPILSL